METTSLVFSVLSFIVAFFSLLAMICIANSTSKFSENQSKIEERLWERNEQQLTNINTKINDFMNLVTIHILKTNITVEEISKTAKDIDDKLDNF